MYLTFRDRYLINTSIVSPIEEHFKLTRLSIAYLSFKYFHEDCQQEEMRKYCQEGCYAFLFYAAVHWLDHLEEFAEAFSSLATTLPIASLATEISKFLDVHFPDMISSSKHKASKLAPLHSSLKLTYGPVSNAVFTWKTVLSAHKEEAEMDPHLLRIIQKICVHLDEVGVQTIVGDSKEDLNTFYGERLYHCSHLDCEYFHKGFPSLHEKSQHSTFHDQVYYCTFSGCPRNLFGFQDMNSFQSHLTEDHPIPPRGNVEFPTYQEPRDIKIEDAIEKKDLEAMKRWADQFPGAIPDEKAGIKLLRSLRLVGGDSYFDMLLTKSGASKSMIVGLLMTGNLEGVKYIFPRLDNPGDLIWRLVRFCVALKQYSILNWMLDQYEPAPQPRQARNAIKSSLLKGEDTVALRLLRIWDKTKTSENFKNPLRLVVDAIESNYLESCRYMLENWQLDVSGLEFGNTILMQASQKGRLEAVQMLLTKYTLEELTPKKKVEDSAISLAAANGHEDIIRILSLSDQKSRSSWLCVAGLRRASKDGDVDEVRRLLLKQDIPVDLPDARGYSPFLHAIANGHTAVVKEYLSSPVKAAININRKCYPRMADITGVMSFVDALCLAVLHGHVEIVSILLREANVSLAGYVRMRGSWKEYNPLSLSEHLGMKDIANLIREFKQQKEGPPVPSQGEGMPALESNNPPMSESSQDSESTLPDASFSD